MKLFFSMVFTICAIALTSTTSIAQSKVAASEQFTTSLEMKVKGVGCKEDVKMISENIKKIKGVESCESGKPRATTAFVVSFNPALVSEEAITAAIEGTPGCEDPNARPYKVKQ